MVCQHARNPPDWACDGGTSPVPPTWVYNAAPAPAPPTGPNPSPPSGQYNVQVLVAHDEYPLETSWSLKDGEGTTWLSQGEGSITVQNEVVSEMTALPAGEYTFEIEDEYADGICCAHGSGSYEVSVNGDILYSGGSFGRTSGELVFCIDDETDTIRTGACEEDHPWWCFWC